MPYRLAEAASAIHSCSLSEAARVPNEALLERAEFILDHLEVERGSEEAERALGDVTSLMAAYMQSEADSGASKAEVRAILEAALEQAQDLDQTLSGVAGRLARRKVDESAATKMLLRAVPAGRGAFAWNRRPYEVALVRRAMLSRSGSVLGKRAARTAPTSIRENLLQSSPVLGPLVSPQTRQKFDDAAAVLDRVLPDGSDLIGLVVESLSDALGKMPKLSSSNASTWLAPGKVLAWGCVELVAAWCQKRRPSTDLSAPVTRLAVMIHDSAYDDDLETRVKRPFAQAVGEAVKAWHEHTMAVAFRGRRAETREKRIADLRAKLLPPVPVEPLDEIDQNLEPLTATDGSPLGMGGRRRMALPTKDD